MENEELKDLYESLVKAIIAKDINVLNELIMDDAQFLHFSEKPLTKNEYLSDVENELFQYFDYEIKHVENNSIILRIDAILYGSKRNWWIFCVNVDYIKEKGKLRIKRSQILG